MPDATGLELLAQEIGDRHAGAITDTEHVRGKGVLHVAPGLIREVLEELRARGYDFLASVHALDYEHEPRLGVQYEVLDMSTVDRITLALRVPTDAPEVPSVTPDWPTAEFQEREAYDHFGIVFTGHPDLRRIHLPEDYEGHPGRRDFPVGGEPVLFTYNQHQGTDYTQ